MAQDTGHDRTQDQEDASGQNRQRAQSNESLPGGQGDSPPWIDFQANEVQDEGYTPVKDDVRGPYLPDQVNQINRAARDDDFKTAGVGGLAEGGGSYGDVGAGTSGATTGRGDTGELGVMGGTDLSDTLGGPGAPDRTAGPAGSEPIGDIDEPEVQREDGTLPPNP